MKVFIGYVLLCFAGATLLRQRGMKPIMWMLIGVVVLVSIAYFFFNQI